MLGGWEIVGAIAANPGRQGPAEYSILFGGLSPANKNAALDVFEISKVELVPSKIRERLLSQAMWSTGRMAGAGRSIWRVPLSVWFPWTRHFSKNNQISSQGGEPASCRMGRHARITTW